jgi:dethiobiotin synthetase
VSHHADGARQARGLFVTGTDTGVGKTLVAGAFVHALAAAGTRVAGFKPVAAGAHTTPEGPKNEDAELLETLGNVAVPYATINPVLAAAPMAPHIALAREGRRFERDDVLAAYRAVRTRADFVVAEGAGGWRVPLTDGYDMADLAGDLGLPIVIVVGLRLGCLNHASLTLESILARGLPVAGWVASHVDPDMTGAVENLATLENALSSKPLAVVPWLEERTAPDRSVAASRHGLFDDVVAKLLSG